MKKEAALNILLVLFGTLVLYVAWGNAPGVLGLGDQCLPTQPRGLHLDSTYQLVYAHDVCTAAVYEYGRLVFFTLSALGLGTIIGGWHRMRRSTARATNT